MVICLERGADLHMAQLMPLPLTVSCFSKIQIGFTFLVLAHQVVPKKAFERVHARVCILQLLSDILLILLLFVRLVYFVEFFQVERDPPRKNPWDNWNTCCRLDVSDGELSGCYIVEIDSLVV